MTVPTIAERAEEIRADRPKMPVADAEAQARKEAAAAVAHGEYVMDAARRAVAGARAHAAELTERHARERDAAAQQIAAAESALAETVAELAGWHEAAGVAAPDEPGEVTKAHAGVASAAAKGGDI